MKKGLLVFIIIIFTLLFGSVAFANDDDVVDITPFLDELLNKTDLSEWNKFVESNDFFAEYTKNLSPKEFILEIIKGEADLTFDGVINFIFGNFLNRLKGHVQNAATLFGIALLCAMLDKLCKGIFDGRICSYGMSLLRLCALCIAVTGFADALSICFNGVDKMTDFMNSSFAIFNVLISTAGTTASSGILSPSVVMITTATSNIIKGLIIPLLTASAVLCVCSSLCDQGIFSSVSGTAKRASDKVLGLTFTIFFGLVTVQKLTAGALDSASLKTVKYTLSSFSMYGGAFLSKSFDVVTGCAVMLKSVVGGVGMMILLSLCLSPAIKLLAVSIIYRFTAFLISCIGETKIASCMMSIGSILGTLFLCVATCAILFFALLTALSTAGNALVGI